MLSLFCKAREDYAINGKRKLHQEKRTMRITFLALILLALLSNLPAAQSRPYIILEDVSYYSNESFQTGMVRDLVEEKNFEEIYQFYSYFEAIYDANDRVKVFKEYERGEIIHEERYVYDDDTATPGTITVLIPGKKPQVTHPKVER
tara:strand:+ start:14729 stop:15169 length:441 start_codon:yes stop_codon:yes gene_type:complete